VEAVAEFHVALAGDPVPTLIIPAGPLSPGEQRRTRRPVERSVERIFLDRSYPSPRSDYDKARFESATG